MVVETATKQIFLYPANICVSANPVCIATLLGTCVAVCLWDKKRKIGGMNHYLLPLWNGDGLASPKYGNIAIARLLERMIAAGAEHSDLVAKVFGGKAATDGGVVAYNIGMRNIALAQETLRELGIPVIAENVGGDFGRNIKFDTATGVVMMKYIKGSKR